MSNETKPITLYTFTTPNGFKPAIALAELNVPYNLKLIDISTNAQKQEWYLKINPNGRIPAITDHKNGDFNVFESGAILLYLAEHYDPNHILLPTDPKEKSTAIQWLMFQMGGIGPMQGQAKHFHVFAPEKIPYAIDRYQKETRRLFEVLERGLDGKEYLAGKYSVADIATYPWVRVHEVCGVSIDGLPRVQAWLERVGQREAVKKGMKAMESK